MQTSLSWEAVWSTASTMSRTSLTSPTSGLVKATQTSLCKRCQAFDPQAFARAPNRRRGYLLDEVKLAAMEGCDFCALLLESTKDVTKPTYFYRSLLGDITVDPDIYVHMTFSENYKGATVKPENPAFD